MFALASQESVAAAQARSRLHAHDGSAAVILNKERGGVGPVRPAVRIDNRRIVISCEIKQRQPYKAAIAAIIHLKLDCPLARSRVAGIFLAVEVLDRLKRLGKVGERVLALALGSCTVRARQVLGRRFVDLPL